MEGATLNHPAVWLALVACAAGALIGGSLMANAVQHIGALRDRVRFERRGRLSASDAGVLWDEGDEMEWPEGDAVDFSATTLGDGAGNYETTWRDIYGVHAARIAPRRGSEEMVADRLSGVDAYDIWVRRDGETKQIRVGDRAVDARDGSRIFNIRFIANPDERRRYLLMQCTLGAADGG